MVIREAVTIGVARSFIRTSIPTSTCSQGSRRRAPTRSGQSVSFRPPTNCGDSTTVTTTEGRATHGAVYGLQGRMKRKTRRGESV